MRQGARNGRADGEQDREADKGKRDGHPRDNNHELAERWRSRERSKGFPVHGHHDGNQQAKREHREPAAAAEQPDCLR